MQKPIILPVQSTTSPTYTLSPSPTYTVSTSTTSPAYTTITTSPSFLNDHGAHLDRYIHESLEPPIPSSYSSDRNHNNNIYASINAPFSNTNNHHQRKRTKSKQQMIYRPLPVSSSKSKHKKKRSTYPAKHKNVSSNRYSHYRSDTAPIMSRPLPPTPPNAKIKRSSNIDTLIPMFSANNNNNIYDPPTKPNYKSLPKFATNTSHGTKGHQSKLRKSEYGHTKYNKKSEYIGHTKYNSDSLSSISNASKHTASSPMNLAILSSTTANNENHLSLKNNENYLGLKNNENYLNYCSKKSDYDINKRDDRKDTDDIVLAKSICFDKYSVQKDIYNYYFHKHTLLSSKGLKSGRYEWSIKIVKCEGSAQEMGIVSNPNINKIKLNDGGLTKTPAFGARAVIGNQLVSGICSYYASYNADNTQRIYKDLSNKNKPSQNCWAKGDIIKIRLDLNKYHISFFLNNKKVRKKISVQPHKIYYPIISFVGDNQYDVTFTVC